jgi:hypothetical protein
MDRGNAALSSREIRHPHGLSRLKHDPIGLLSHIIAVSRSHGLARSKGHRIPPGSPLTYQGFRRFLDHFSLLRGRLRKPQKNPETPYGMATKWQRSAGEHRVTSDELRKLRRYYHSLEGHRRVLDRVNDATVPDSVLGPISSEVARLEKEFPDILGFKPQFETAYNHSNAGKSWFTTNGIRAILASVLGRLEVEIEQTEPTPVVQARDFTFVQDAKLRAILERDYVEIQKAYISASWKSVLILTGGALEAVLLDLKEESQG